MIKVEKELASVLAEKLSLKLDEDLFFGTTAPELSNVLTVMVEGVATPINPSLTQYEVSIKGRYFNRDDALNIMLGLRQIIPLYAIGDIKAVLPKQMAQIYNSTTKSKEIWNVSCRVLTVTI